MTAEERREYYRAWRANNSDKIAQYYLRWRAKNLDKITAYKPIKAAKQRERRNKNTLLGLTIRGTIRKRAFPEKDSEERSIRRNARNRHWKKQNRFKMNLAQRRWRKINPVKVRIQLAKYRARNSVRLKELCRAWYQKNRTMQRLKNSERHRKNRETILEKQRQLRRGEAGDKIRNKEAVYRLKKSIGCDCLPSGLISVKTKYLKLKRLIKQHP